MKRRIEDYTFDASAKTITFAEAQAIKLEGIMIVVNVTVGNTTIYSPFDSTLAGTASGNVLTVTYDTSAAMADTDDLLIVYWDSGSKTKKAIRNLTAAQAADTALIAAPGANKHIVLHYCGANASAANVNNTEVQMSFEAISQTDDALSANDVWHPGIPPGGGFIEPMNNLEGPANTSFDFITTDPDGQIVVFALYHIMDLAENT